MEPEADETASEPPVRDAAPSAIGSMEPPDLARLPPLSALAAVAAVSDLILRRGLLRTISDRLERSELRALGPWFDLSMNLAAIAGLVAVTVGLFRLLSARLSPPFAQPPTAVRIAEAMLRAVTAGFAGILLPAVAIATFFPVERTSSLSVFAAAAAAYLLVVQVSLMAARCPGSVGLRTASFLLGASALSGLFALVLGELGPQLGWVWAYDLHRVASVGGELSLLLVPLAVLPTVIPRQGGFRTAAAIALGTTLGLSAMVTFDIWRVYLGPNYDAVLYGAVRFEALLGELGLLYAVPFGFFLGLGAGALASARPNDRQIGAAALALLAAGFGPRTPAQVLMLVLGATLLGRATIAAGIARARERASA